MSNSKKEIEEQAKDRMKFEILMEQKLEQLEIKIKKNEEEVPITNDYSDNIPIASSEINK